MDKTRFFNSTQEGDTLVLAFYDAIGDDMFLGGITPKMVSDALAQDDYSDIQLRLNSPGGDAFAGVAIYNVLRACSKPVAVVVDGMAASAASIVAMAGDTITMAKGSVMMIHEAQGVAMGDANTMLKMADTLKTVTGSIADIYTARTKNSKKSVLEMMATETWMDSKEAVEKGFATSVGQESAVKNSFDLSKFKNAPVQLQAKTKRVANEDLTASCFIYVGDPDKTDTWHLPWHFATEEKTQSHLRDALGRFDQAEIPESHKAECWAKLVRLCKEHGIEVNEKENEARARIELLRKRLELNKRK